MVALTIPVISNNFTLFYNHVRTRSRDDGEEKPPEIPPSNYDEESRIYENGRRTSNGSVLLSEKNRKLSDLSTLCAAPYTNRTCNHNGDARHGQSLFQSDPKHCTSTSMIDMGTKNEENEYVITNEGAMKARSDDGVTYSGIMV